MLDSTEKIRNSLLGLVALTVVGCVVEAPQPDLGACSEPPAGRTVWEYGEVGVGTCLASPSDLRVVPDPENPANHFVLVANSNSRSNFTGSSMLSIDASRIELACPVNGLHEVAADALEMREFAGRFDIDPVSGLGLLTSRYSGGFEGDLTDAMFVLDLSDPRDLQFSDLGPRETGPYRWMRVPGDPWSVRINPATGRAYVLSLIHHTVSAVDLLADPLEIVDLYGERATTPAVFEDVDGSGSAPDFELIGVNEAALKDETLSLTWVVGTTRLYYSAEDGSGGSALFQADSGNGVDFHVLAGGPVLRPTGSWSEGGFGAAAVAADEIGLFGLIEGSTALGGRSIGSIESSEHALNWTASDSPVLSPSLSDWDAAGVFHPDWVSDGDTTEVYYSGGSGLGDAIGRATGSTFASLTRSGDPDLPDGDAGVVLAPEAGGFDGSAVFGPSVIIHGDTGEYLLYYAGHDDPAALDEVPVGTSIGLARSLDGQSFSRDHGSPVLEPGDVGSWDSEAVAFPSVFYDNGRFQMWYQGWDGSQWSTGRALSVDGRTWEKDPRNPVFDGVLDAQARPSRAFAYKASPGGYYRIDGTVSGDAIDYALEGAVYETIGSPILFQVVGGHALGRGAAGEHDADGALSPSALDDGTVLYVGQQGSSKRLASATDLGAALDRVAPVTLAGFGGPLSDLNGSAPTLAIEEISAVDAGGEILVALETEAGIALAHGPLPLAAGDPIELAARAATSVLDGGEAGTFDAVSVGAPELVPGVGGEDLLFYEGFDGQATSIGLARSSDGLVWTRQGDEPVFGRGAAGAWDDAWVASPAVAYDTASGTFHLWYVGSDGSVDRIGYATSSDAVEWVRHTDSAGVSVPVFDGDGLPFALDGVARPSVTLTADGFEMWFEGISDGVHRLGRVRSVDGVIWTPVLNPTTAGDNFSLRTSRGDDDPSSAIQLGDDSSSPRLIDGYVVHGAGATEMILSPDGHHAVVSNKRSPFLIVLDLWDDSDDDYVDANHNDIEAVIRVSQAHGMVGMRDLRFGPEGDLWALMSPMIIPEMSPVDEPSRFGSEGLLRIDWQRVVAEDVPLGKAWNDVVLSFLPLARGVEEDVGYDTEVSVGASSLAMNAAGTRAYVTNFNENSLYVMDLASGARGSIKAAVQGLDENPWEVELSPDERLAYVATSYGVEENGAQHSTIQIVDVDESSPTFGRVLTRLTNIESRSEHGCQP